MTATMTSVTQRFVREYVTSVISQHKLAQVCYIEKDAQEANQGEPRKANHKRHTGYAKSVDGDNNSRSSGLSSPRHL